MTADETPLDLADDPRGTLVAVRAQPGARRSGILGRHDGAVRVAVAVAPEGGRANAAVAAVLADALSCRPSRVVLVAGPTGRRKRFLVTDMAPDAVRDALDRALPSPRT